MLAADLKAFCSFLQLLTFQVWKITGNNIKVQLKGRKLVTIFDFLL
jgi:hypothetical protein